MGSGRPRVSHSAPQPPGLGSSSRDDTHPVSTPTPCLGSPSLPTGHLLATGSWTTDCSREFPPSILRARPGEGKKQGDLGAEQVLSRPGWAETAEGLWAQNPGLAASGGQGSPTSAWPF